MKTIFKSFYARLSLVFLLLLLALGTIQILIAVRSSIRFMKEADQKLNLPLAGNMAAELAPFLQDSLTLPAIEDKIHYMMVMNPKVEIYLLNSQGKILAFFADPRKKVRREFIDLQPIRKFVNGDRAELILGDDPRDPASRKPFSAAPLTIGKDLGGFLYIILGGEQYETAAGMVRESFIIRTMIIGLILTVIFTGIAGLILFFVLTRRLKVMTSVVRRFEKGELGLRIPLSSRDEIGQLGHSFNSMADTLANNMEELKRTDNLRRELVANVSHDLRSPLASIRGYLETVIMKEESLSAKDRSDYLNIILNNAVMLGHLVEELFELSKLDAHQIQPKPEKFSLAELVQDVVLKFQPMAEEAGIHLESLMPPQPAMVRADIGLIERALSNLIENALKFTSSEGSVRVVISREDQGFRTTVSDSGPGIPADELPHVFERFYRGDRSRASKAGGTGLGLAIARKILQLHDSDIGVDSQLNAGTQFYFDLS